MIFLEEEKKCSRRAYFKIQFTKRNYVDLNNMYANMHLCFIVSSFVCFIFIVVIHIMNTQL